MNALQDEMVAGVSFTVALGKNGYSIGSFSALKTFVIVIYTLLRPHVFLWLRPESFKFKKNKIE